jgi:hypothetical protein
MDVLINVKILCLMQDLVPKASRDWALETSVLKSIDKDICTCDIKYASFFYIIFNFYWSKQS